MLYNLREYHRPGDLDEAIRLLKRPDIHTVALAGGVSVVGEGTPEVEAVVDLDGLGLDFVEEPGGALRLGAMVRLQTLFESLTHVAHGVLSDAARRMAGWHVRNAATLGGALAGSEAGSPLGVVLAALGAQVTAYDGRVEQTAPWLELSARDPAERFKGCLITAVALDLPAGIGAAYEQVARTPADHPIVCAAAVVKPAGEQVEATIVVGGLLKTLVSVRDVAAPDVIDRLADRVLAADADESDYVSNYLGGPAYRQGVAPVLARRALNGAMIRADLRSG